MLIALALTALALAQPTEPPTIQLHSDTLLPAGLGASSLTLNPTITATPTLALYAPGVLNPNWRTFSVPLLLNQQTPPTLSLSTDLSWQASHAALISLEGHLPTRAAPVAVAGQLVWQDQGSELPSSVALCLGTPLTLGHRVFDLSLCAAPSRGSILLSGSFGGPTPD